MLTNRITRRVDLPHEPDQWVELRVLSFRQLREARDVRATEQLGRQMRAMAALSAVSADLISAVTEARAPVEGAEPAALPDTDPLEEYDVDTLLQAGIVGWSYYEGPASVGDIAALDEETAMFIARELLPGRDEADRKNGSKRSTAHSTA